MAKHYEPKEYVWNLMWDGEDKVFKVLVTDTECITYEGDKEHKHLKIMNPVRKNKVLQIDTVTSVYGKQVPFQLENGVPYIKLDDVWKMSDTNRADRIAQGARVNKLSAGIEIGAGIVICAVMAIMYLLGMDLGQWWILIPMGVMLIVGGFSMLSRLKAEMEAIATAEREEAEARAAARAARAEGNREMTEKS